MDNNVIDPTDVLIGMFMPLPISLAKGFFMKEKKKWVAYVIGFLSCVIAGVFKTYLAGESFTDVAQLATTLGTVFMTAQTAYNTYWKSSGVDLKVVESIKTLTTKEDKG